MKGNKILDTQEGETLRPPCGGLSLPHATGVGSHSLSPLPRVVKRMAADVDTRTEKQLEAQVKQLARMYGYIYYHTHRSQFSPSGFPDCHMIHVEQRRIIYAELKRTPKDKLRPAQEEYRDALLAVGAEWYRWDWSTPVEDIIAILMRRPRTIDRANPGVTIEIST